MIDGAGPFTGFLSRDGTVTIHTSGTARWLTLGGRRASKAFCNDQRHDVEHQFAEVVLVYVPPGTNILTLQ